MKSALLLCLLAAFPATTLATSPQYSPRKDIVTGLTDIDLDCLAVADFNGDGRPDFVVADMRGKNIQVYLNQGGGNFSAPVITTQSDPTLAEGPLVTGDFDEDGKQDLIVSPLGIADGPYDADAIFYSGNGDGTFTQRSRISAVSWIFAATVTDLNHDSHLDLLSASDPPKVAYGDGHGSFSIQTYSGISPLAIGFAVGDFDQDGKSEIVESIGSTSLGSNSIALGRVQMMLPPLFQSGITIDQYTTSPGTIASADFNGDGKPDLLFGGLNFDVGLPNTATVLLGNGDLTFSPRILLPLPDSVVQGQAYTAIADINNDQKPDVVVADEASNTLSIFLNDGTGTFPQTAPDFTADLPKFVGQLQTADFNGDGLPDIIVTNYQNENVSIFFSQTTPTVSLASTSVSAFAGSPISFTVEATTLSGVMPTGIVTLMDGTTSLGQQALDSSGTATFSLSNLAIGQHSLTAAYSGDTNFTSATSAALAQSITDFQVALPTASQTVTAGGTATYSLNVTPVAGLTGSITITCSQLPSLATCDPLTLPINGQPATATLTVHTAAAVTRSAYAIHAAIFGLLSFALLPFCRRRSLRVLALAFTIIGLTTGCGGANSSAKAPTVISPGTPQGSTQFTVTSAITLGGQTLTHASTATLVVR